MALKEQRAALEEQYMDGLISEEEYQQGVTRIDTMSGLTYDNGQPMFDENGMMLDDQGARSIFDDVDD